MTKLVCDFRFEDHTYVVLADFYRRDVHGIEAVSTNKGPRAAEVKDHCATVGALLAGGMCIDVLAGLTKIGPIDAAIVACVVRARDRAQASIATAPSERATKMIAGDPL